MSDQPQKPILFTEAEQLKLQELQANAEGFNNFQLAVSRSLHSGQDTALIANLITFLKQMSAQSSQQIEQIKTDAQARSNALKEESKEEVAKPELKKSKKAS